VTLDVSVVIPVKDGGRFLAEVLDAVLAQGPLEVVVVDSGSTDGSVELVRARGDVELHQIAPEDFGHGRTRQWAVARTQGDVVAFLTQDATPQPGWLEAIRAGFALGERVGVVYGPQLPRPGTSPMIARELTTFFATHPVGVQPAGFDFLSNVNAAYRRACLADVPFPDVPYSEDQHVARALPAADWQKAYVPEMVVLHAHDYPPVAFMRRYFDEYRGLREAVGHVERFGGRSAVRIVRDGVASDRAWMREQGFGAAAQRRWTVRSVVHHGGRRVFSTLGSRAASLPAPIQRRLSLEGTVAKPVTRTAEALATRQVAGDGGYKFEAVKQLEVHGPTPLLTVLDRQGDADGPPLHVAVVLPPFRRGSGGHATLFELCVRLEAAGHTLTYWLHDPTGELKEHRPARLRGDVREWFAPVEGPVFSGFADWFGCDVALATGWQTVHPVATLSGTRARAYLVQDHETEFYATSVERIWAEATYGMGFHGICASPWLGELVGAYGMTHSVFDLGVEPGVYHPREDVVRRTDTVAMYGRDVTPRRAVPLAVLALELVRERRPDLRIVSFGNAQPIHTPFGHEHAGVLDSAQLAALYAEATLGLVLSLTNYSRIPKEMLACGLPVVDLAGISAESVFGDDGPVALAPPTVTGLAATIERLLDDPAERERRGAAGLAFVAGHTWDRAAGQVEAGLREALRHRAATPAVGS
jgi:O-antigen biosynthesis protein